jgi:phosphate:Na+ symporter
VANSIIFFPLIPALQKVVEKLVKPAGDAIDVEPQYLEKHLLETPSIALEQAKKEILRMLELSGSAVKNAYEMYRTGKSELARKVARREQAVDNLQSEITRYLIDISMEELEEENAEMIPVLIHSVNDIERIADNAVNIVELGQRRTDEDISFSEEATGELDNMYSIVIEMLGDVARGLETEDLEAAREAMIKEEELNGLQRSLRISHTRRLNEGSCLMISGIVFIDCVDCFEKIGDHLSNIAVGLLGGLRWE